MLFGLQRKPGTRRRRGGQVPCERCPDGGADSGNLVLGLERLHAEVFLLRQFFENRGGRCDRIRPEEQRQVGGSRTGDEPPCECCVPGDVGVLPLRQRSWLHLEGVVELLRRDAVVVAGTERRQVCRGNRAISAELAGIPLFDRSERAGVHPGHQPQREEVLRPQHRPTLHPGTHQCLLGEFLHRSRQDMEPGQGTILEWTGFVVRLGKVPLIERIPIDDDQRTRLEVVDIRLQRRRVHGDQAVGAIPRCEDVPVGDVHLERGDSGDRAGRRANFCGEIRERREVVAEHRRAGGELGSGQLHAVTGVAGEADHDPIDLLRCRLEFGVGA